MQIFLTGASGAVGHELGRALQDAGHEVVAATRRPEEWTGPGRAVPFDLDADQIDPTGALASADAAYYLVHALERNDFVEVDRRRAERFVAAWGPTRPVVYLGGLGRPGTGSPHLRSRHEVGEILRAETATVELRASIVLGPASLSFRLLQSLGRVASCSLLPVPVPRAATALTQPIAQRDLTTALVQALESEPGCYDLGGPDVVSFAQLIERSARAQGRSLTVVPSLPFGAEWLGPGAALVAGVDPWATIALFSSMADETVVRPGRHPRGVDRPTTGLDDALRLALGPAA